MAGNHKMEWHTAKCAIQMTGTYYTSSICYAFALSTMRKSYEYGENTSCRAIK